MIQAHLHFPTLLTSARLYPGSLRGPCGREGRERKGEGGGEGGSLGRGAEGLMLNCSAESRCRGDGSGWSSAERAALRDRDRPGARAGGGSPAGRDAARGERGRRHGRVRARGRPTCWRAALSSVPSRPHPTPGPPRSAPRLPSSRRARSPARESPDGGAHGTAGVKGVGEALAFSPSLLVRAVRRLSSSRCQSEPG